MLLKYLELKMISKTSFQMLWTPNTSELATNLQFQETMYVKDDQTSLTEYVLLIHKIKVCI